MPDRPTVTEITKPRRGRVRTPPTPTASSENDARLLSVKTVAARLECGRTTVYGLMNTGRLEYVLLGSERRVPEAALTAFIASLPSS